MRRVVEKGCWVQLAQHVKRTPPERIPEGRMDNRTAYVLSVGEGGEVHLDRDLNGMRWWHLTDLQRARHQSRHPIRSVR